MLREKLKVITESSNSNTVKHITEILEEVWLSQVGGSENFMMDGLGKLLRSANIGGPTSDS